MASRVIATALLAASLLSAGWAAAPTDEQEIRGVEAERAAAGARARYERALRDAATAEPSEVAADLVPVTESNESLVWAETEIGRAVLVVTWTSSDRYGRSLGEAMETTSDTWVTVVPEVAEICRSLPVEREEVTSRLEGLLGLPPGAGKTTFAALWVDPADLFRPCPDPEITDTRCDLDFPPDVSEAHRRWMTDRAARSYGPDGYPWTRLGYTYDWASPDSPVGPSELVVRRGATVLVESVAPTAEYCVPATGS